ncbi:MAG: helix-turn-helix transcriptional regulator [Lysobacterales bacterium]|jgi:transcriptional regulator with XRE-family HTH domain
MDAKNALRGRVATNLKELMNQAGMRSQAQLAEATGVSQSQIGNILRGERSASVDTLECLANGLGCEPWLVLSPTTSLAYLKNHDIALIVHILLRLMPNDLEAILRITQQLYESTRTNFID